MSSSQPKKVTMEGGREGGKESCAGNSQMISTIHKPSTEFDVSQQIAEARNAGTKFTPVLDAFTIVAVNVVEVG